MGGQRLTYDDRQARRRQKGFNDDKTVIDGNPVYRKPEDGTLKRYEKQWKEWLTYCQTHPGTTPHDLKEHQTAKHYIEWVAQGLQPSRPADGDVSVGTVELAWKDTSAMYVRKMNEKLPPGMSKSMQNYIWDVLVDKIPLRVEPRERKYLTAQHFKVLLTQLWGNDWYEFEYPIYRLYLSALLKLLMFSSGRIGEYVESSARRASGRGMYREDILFIAVQNVKGQPEILSRAKRDPKGQSRTKRNHPRFPVYEDIGNMALYLNPVMELVAIAVAQGAFRDFTSVDQILALRPEQDRPYELTLVHKDWPFFAKMSEKGLTREILTASWLATEIKKLCHRAGYPNHITGHDIRAEALIKADQHGYSTDERMKFGGHVNPRTFFASYASSTSSVDGISNIFENLPRRKDHVDIFRGWSLAHHPRLWQALPAKLQFDLAYSPEAEALTAQIDTLNRRIRDPDVATPSPSDKARRQALYAKRSQLMASILHKWQVSLPGSSAPGQELEGPMVDHHWTLFGRVSHLMPERKRLSCSLFLEVSTREQEGMVAWADLVALAKRKTPVEGIPGLETCAGRCPISRCNKPVDGLPMSVRWRHLIRCGRKYRLRLYKFAQFCWLGCLCWFTNLTDWEEHCQWHIKTTDFSPQWGLLMFQGILASPGICPWCRLGTSATAATRLRQFWDQREFNKHINDHLDHLRETTPKGRCFSCPTQEDWPCASSSFESIFDLQCHLQDYHCHAMARRQAQTTDAKNSHQTITGRKRKFSVATPASFESISSNASKRSSVSSPRRLRNALQETHSAVSVNGTQAAFNGCLDPILLPRSEEAIQCQTLKSSSSRARHCPVCNAPVAKNFWSQNGYAIGENSVRIQRKFCLSHRRDEARHEWEMKLLPAIKWEDLQTRVARFHFQIDLSLQSNLLLCDPANQETGNGTFGYYGPRGAEIILDYLNSNVGCQISELIAEENLETNWSPLKLAQEVLVPQLLCLLVQEDLVLSEEDARRVMRETSVLGELLNPLVE